MENMTREDVGDFVELLYEHVRSNVSPTPIYEITDGERVEVDYLGGHGNLPSDNSFEVTALDINVASLFFDDFHVLYEGETGAGKTYGSETLFETVFGKDGYYSIEMRDDVLAASPTDKFTHVDQQTMKPEIDHEAVERYGGMFIDELNRARDTNDIISIVDGEVTVNGDRAELGIPIPGTNRKKGLAIIAAMNPHDAEYTDTREMDLAGVNRWVKFRYPDNVDESGAGQLDRSERNGLHEDFWEGVLEETGLDGEWREVYPLLTDPQLTGGEIDYRTSEFLTGLLGFVGRDPGKTFKRNRDLAQDAGYGLNFGVDSESNYLQQLREAQGNLRGNGTILGRRDLEQINDTAQMLGFIRGVKEQDYDFKASLTDVVAATGVVAESKRVSGTEYGEIIGLVDDARIAYSDMIGTLEEYRDAEISDDRGIRDTIWQSAVLDGQRNGYQSYRSTVQSAIEELNDTQPENPVEGVLRSRIIADLAVLDNFSENYREDVEYALDTEFADALERFSGIVDDVDTSIGKHASVYDRLSFVR